ncbi:MAG: biopolymer transporter ExbD [Inquilinus sp.]|nr:biopolymer transporter ExbD [Inquilinus sp.]
MRVRRQPPRRPHETIVTLIDIVFFLLGFFMLVGRMDASSPFELSPPVSLGGEALPAGGATISVSVEGRLALDGTERSRAEIVDRLRQRANDDSEPLFVRVNADGAAPVRHLLSLIGALESLADGDVVLVVTPEPP